MRGELLSTLADEIGVRRCGTEAAGRAADAIADAFRELGLEPSFQEFPFLRFDPEEPELWVDGERWTVGPCMYAHPGTCEGPVERLADGRWAVGERAARALDLRQGADPVHCAPVDRRPYRYPSDGLPLALRQRPAARRHARAPRRPRRVGGRQHRAQRGRPDRRCLLGTDRRRRALRLGVERSRRGRQRDRGRRALAGRRALRRPAARAHARVRRLRRRGGGADRRAPVHHRRARARNPRRRRRHGQPGLHRLRREAAAALLAGCVPRSVTRRRRAARPGQALRRRHGARPGGRHRPPALHRGGYPRHEHPALPLRGVPPPRGQDVACRRAAPGRCRRPRRRTRRVAARRAGRTRL